MFTRRRHRLSVSLRRLGVESLEDRIALTGNIAITDAYVVDGSNNPPPVVNAGDWVWIHADWTTQNLPSNASYRIAFMVNGLMAYTGAVTAGAGDSTATWHFYWGSFLATPGTNQVTVTMDPDQSVAETSYTDNTTSVTFNAVSPAAGGLSYTAAQIRAAYGINSIPNFGSSLADGSGQTIGIIEVGNDPNILTDLDGFDRAMTAAINSTTTLYQQYGAASTFVNVYNQNNENITANIGTSGSNGVPAADPDWVGEETLDVEWAHAIAPGAKIDIVEVNGGANWGVDYAIGDSVAAGLPGVSVVSNSVCWNEWNGETAYDSSTFVTPSGHTGVTFLASSGDNGDNGCVAYGPSLGNDGYYPATSPNVVSVGGTELAVNSNAYGGETGWSFPAPRTLNYDSSSYAESGPWSPQQGGFSGTYGVVAGGSVASATWSAAVSSADGGWLGVIEASATWTPSSDNATNATYTIYDGSQASGTVLGTVAVDETKAPVGAMDNTSQFQELGDFFPTSGTLTVVLNANSANGSVVADAVGIAQAGLAPVVQASSNQSHRTNSHSRAPDSGQLPTCHSTQAAE